MGGLVKPVFTYVDVLFADTLGPPLTESVQVHHTATSHNTAKGNDLIDWYTEHLV